MAKAMGNGVKQTFGKRKEGLHVKRKSPKDKNTKPNKGQG